jgi:hypothetical protein
MLKKFAIFAILVVLAGCAERYSLVNASTLSVAKNSITVTPPRSWNRMPRSPDQSTYEERWTENGPLLDTISFFGGVPDGGVLLKQAKKVEHKVPVFKSNMTAQDISSQLESFYRIRMDASNFQISGLTPRIFAGGQGFQIDFKYTSAGNLKRTGRAVGLITNRKLYLVELDAARDLYFEAALPDFEAIVNSARIG